MFKGVDHVVVAVKDLDASIGKYEAIYGAPVSDRSESAPAGMKMAFFRFGDAPWQLLALIVANIAVWTQVHKTQKAPRR